MCLEGSEHISIFFWRGESSGNGTPYLVQSMKKGPSLKSSSQKHTNLYFRCVLTTVDPLTGEKDPDMEPLRTLRKFVS